MNYNVCLNGNLLDDDLHNNKNGKLSNEFHSLAISLALNSVILMDALN